MTVITETNKERAQSLVSQLTLGEKLGMIHGAGLFRTEGVPRLGIPPFVTSDGPMGVRREFADNSWNAIYGSQDYVTYLPSGSAIGSTWNTELARIDGEVLGAEARGRGKDMILGPSVNIKRSPLCGRNFEYISEDPYLAAAMSSPLIQGIQESDVASCVKHFAANSQETDRLLVNENISDRALREIYLPVFESAVKQGEVLGVMGAYNLVNGERCCESRTLLDDILRDEWNFEGLTVSDWGGVFRTKESAEAGLDMEMSVTPDFDDYKFASPLKAAVDNGEIDEKHIDMKVFHILCVMDALHMLSDDDSACCRGMQRHDRSKQDPIEVQGADAGTGHAYDDPQARDDFQVPSRKAGTYAKAEHRNKVLEIARESVILLKNEPSEAASLEAYEPLLPLPAKTMQNLLVVGANADRVHSNGGGSAEIKAQYEVTPLLGLCGQLGGNCKVTYVPGYEAIEHDGQGADWQAESLKDGVSHGENIDNERQRELRDEAVALAAQYEHVVFIGGLNHDYDLEGLDRKNMRLPYGQDELIEALLDVNPNTIVTLVGGSPVEMPWADRAKAIVWSWYSGCETGTALANVLLGSVNPSGHLPESFPIRLEDSPAHKIGTFGLKGQVDYTEDIYVGYRYYETEEQPVQFCFGHGLSYTSFAYSDLDIRIVDGEIRVHCTVTNTGDRPGKTVLQVYFGLEGVGEDRPVKELKGFTKVSLNSGERKDIRIDLPVSKALRYYSNMMNGYALANQAAVYVGESVQDIRLTADLAVPATPTE